MTVVVRLLLGVETVSGVFLVSDVSKGDFLTSNPLFEPNSRPISLFKDEGWYCAKDLETLDLSGRERLASVVVPRRPMRSG